MAGGDGGILRGLVVLVVDMEDAQNVGDAGGDEAADAGVGGVQRAELCRAVVESSRSTWLVSWIVRGVSAIGLAVLVFSSYWS